MKIPPAHRWDVTPQQAMQIQRELARRVIEEDRLGGVKLVAGVDVGFEGDGNKTARAAVVVLNLTDLQPVDSAVARMPVTFPYIPGLLAFREGPAVLAAWEKVQHKPDVVMFDGQGIAHPRGMGIASQMGLWIERPTI